MKDDILVYGAEWCGFCHQAMRYFDDKKIKYRYIDVDNEKGAAEESVKKSGQRGIPVIDIDGDIIIGFDRPRIDESLKAHALAQ